jgi:hypothetical protein
MLRGPQRFEYVESTADYHQVANPLISPIKGVQMRLPQSLDNVHKNVRQLGPLVRGVHPVVPDNGWHNTVAAFRKRCNYFSAKRASTRVIDAAMEFSRVLTPKKMPEFNWTEKLYEEWLEKFGTEKQERMNIALAGLANVTKLDQYSSKEIFVKVEALLVTHKPNWAPRVIFKGTDLYNAISGPIFNELMRRFDHSLEHMKGPYRFRTAYRKTPCQYVPTIERQSENDFWVEADFSSNDKFQCSDVQLLEVAFMRTFGCPEWFIRLHLKTNNFKVTNYKHGIKARLSNQLPTGATDTTFRNTIWNGCILYCFLKTIKAEDCTALILGDDMLARVNAKVSYVQKIYTSIAAEAQMEATVVRHNRMFTASFLSRLFIPHLGRQHLTVPILGKAIGRFNMRANENQAVSDHAYMAGKSVGYAYEFRYYPTIRNIFLQRFKHEWAFVISEKKGGVNREDIELGVSWNAKAAGVTLKNIKDKLVVNSFLSDEEFNAFCYERYRLLGIDVVDAFSDVVLNSAKIDLEGIVVQKLMADVVPFTLYGLP